MRLRLVRDGQSRILATCTDRGDRPLEEFLKSLEGTAARDREKLLARLAYVAQRGPMGLPEDVPHQVDDQIWQFTAGRLRVLWFYDRGKLVIVSHGFMKKSQKCPQAEKDSAATTMRAYFGAKAEGALRMVDQDDKP